VTSAEKTRKGAFAPTRWSVVASAAAPNSTARRSGLEELCQLYWAPLYAFIRKEGYPSHDAQDLTQACFEKLLEKKYLRQVDRQKGKFRSFLLASVKHFLANERVRSQALKRGGGQVHLSLDFDSAETKCQLQLADPATAEALFDRQWATTLLDHVLSRLQKEYLAAGKSALFEQLRECLSSPRGAIPYSALGEKIAMSEGAVKVAVHRLRQRYRELLRVEIARTVQSPSEIEEELRYLFTILSR
jgi:RNA polymerase sigma factor (sigma-70 family)